MNKVTTALVAMFLLWSFPVHAQSADLPVPAQGAGLPVPAQSVDLPVPAQANDLNDEIKAFGSLGKSDAEYRLGPGDLIEVGVFGVDNFTHTLRISASGVIKLPLLDPITAMGLTPAELEERLTVLLDGDVIKNPQVSVFVKEYRSQAVYVLGAVHKPGQYQITLQLKIVDVLSMAGGLQPNAVDEAVIQRRSPEGDDQVIKINLRELLEKGDLALNVVVRGGDVINIQERLPQMVYVIGEVSKAGAYQLPAKQDLRISQMFAWAGGPLRTAKMSEGILLRYNAQGERQELPVNFAEILKGAKEDFLVRANDIIFVPGSKAKSIGYSLLSIVPGMVGSIPFVVIP